MKKVIACVLIILMLPCFSLAEVSQQQLVSLSDADRAILKSSVDLALTGKKDETIVTFYSYQLDVDLIELSVEELTWIRDYLNASTAHAQDCEQQPIYAKYNIVIDVHDEPFKESKGLFDGIDYSFYESVADICEHLDYIAQNNNPEIVFDYDSQHLEIARFYLTYFESCTANDAKKAIEEYTDVCLNVITDSYPNLQIDCLFFCWCIPSINADSLYAATFFCESKDGTLIRGEGNGLIYQ